MNPSVLNANDLEIVPNFEFYALFPTAFKVKLKMIKLFCE